MLSSWTFLHLSANVRKVMHAVHFRARPPLGPGCGAAGQTRPKAVPRARPAGGRCTAQGRRGTRSARRRTSSRTKRCAAAFHRLCLLARQLGASGYSRASEGMASRRVHVLAAPCAVAAAAGAKSGRRRRRRPRLLGAISMAWGGMLVALSLQAAQPESGAARAWGNFT